MTATQQQLRSVWPSVAVGLKIRITLVGYFYMLFMDTFGTFWRDSDVAVFDDGESLTLC